jgi:hypothetical protein
MSHRDHRRRQSRCRLIRTKLASRGSAVAIHLVVLLVTILIAVGYLFQALVAHDGRNAMQEAQ